MISKFKKQTENKERFNCIENLNLLCSDVLRLVVDYEAPFILDPYLEIVSKGLNTINTNSNSFLKSQFCYKFFSDPGNEKNYQTSTNAIRLGLGSTISQTWMHHVESIALPEDEEKFQMILVDIKEQFTIEWKSHLEQLEQHWNILFEGEIVKRNLSAPQVRSKNSKVDLAETLINWFLRKENYGWRLNQLFLGFFPMLAILEPNRGVAWILLFCHLANKIHQPYYQFFLQIGRQTLKYALYFTSTCIHIREVTRVGDRVLGYFSQVRKKKKNTSFGNVLLGNVLLA